MNNFQKTHSESCFRKTQRGPTGQKRNFREIENRQETDAFFGKQTAIFEWRHDAAERRISQKQSCLTLPENRNDATWVSVVSYIGLSDVRNHFGFRLPFYGFVFEHSRTFPLSL